MRPTALEYLWQTCRPQWISLGGDCGLGGPEGALGLAIDVTDAASVDAAVAAHVRHFGGLDVMVANAGIAVTAPLVETTAEQWQLTMDVNVKGVLHCYQSAARQMISQGRGGRLIGAASVAAHRGGKWQSAYSASKFAVRGMSQSVAQELAEHQITVNVYSPGVVDTPMWEGIDAEMSRRTGTRAGSEMAGMVAGIPLARLETPTMLPGSWLSWPRPRRPTSPDSRSSSTAGCGFRDQSWFS